MSCSPCMTWSQSPPAAPTGWGLKAAAGRHSESAVSDHLRAALLPMIAAGITDINAGTGLAPGAEDLIYGGDLAKWEIFANTLKLKILVQQFCRPVR